MSRKKRELSADETKLWKRVTESVKARRSLSSSADREAVERSETEGVAGRPQKKASPPSSSAPRQTLPPRAGEEQKTLANRGAEKRVRRGKVEIEATLDLHGYTQDAAYTALATFLQSAHRRGARTALVITGAGRSGEGVLKARLPGWLAAKELKLFISGYASAHRQHGGAGAFYVFLKRRGDAT